MKIVFVAMSGDLLHPGHLNILEVARTYGDVVVGLATDELNANHKQIATMDYAHRKALIQNIKGVVKVIPQATIDLEENLRKIKPDYVVHGDDWKQGRLQQVRQRVIEVITEWGGQLIEPSYTEGVSSTALREKLLRRQRLPEQRIRYFRKMLNHKSLMRVLGVYDGLSAQVAERTEVEQNGRFHSFDAMWLTNEADSLAKGTPLSYIGDQTSRLQTVHHILDRTNKPLLVDLSSQNRSEILQAINTFERIGVSAAVVNRGNHLQTSLQANDAFIEFVKQIKTAQLNQTFSLIVAISPQEVAAAMDLAQELIFVGADALLLELPQAANGFVNQFLRRIAEISCKVPVMLNAIQYSSQVMIADGSVQVLMAYPNQLICCAFLSLMETAADLLKNGRSPNPDVTAQTINRFYQNE